MPRWRDISTYRPGIDPDEVLVADDRGFMCRAAWAFSTWRVADHTWGYVNPTHWQPLPPLPGDSHGSQSEGEALEWVGDDSHRLASDGVVSFDAFQSGECLIWQADKFLSFPTNDQSAAMELAQGISDAIRQAQGEPGGGTT